MRIAWTEEDELENIKIFKVSFKEAREVVINKASFAINNLSSDFLFIGPTEILDKILVVNCVKEGSIRRIVYARLANKKEQDTFFQHLILGDLK